MRHVTDEGLNLIRRFEGLRLEAYPDPGTGGGPWTIGHGHTGPEVAPGMVITREQAGDYLRHDVASSERSVLRLINVPLSDGQFDALVSFAFNLGGGALQRSALRRKVNREEHDDVPAEFLKWCRAGGRRLPGLARRRAAEAALYRR